MAERKNKKWPLSPNGCVFTNNHVVRTKPNPKPMVILGAVRDLQSKGNAAYDVQAPPQEAAWALWFTWEKEKPAVKEPKRLTEAQVGPDAPEDS